MSGFLRRVPVMARFGFLGVLTVLVAVAASLVFVKALRAVSEQAAARSAETRRSGHARWMADATRSMSLGLEELLKGTDDATEREAIVRRHLRDVRYGEDGTGYYFVYRGTVVVSLGPKPKLEGRDLGDTKDVDGVPFVRDLARVAQDGGGFVDYVFPKPGFGDAPKLSYAEMIPGTDMWIGTGVYIDDVEAAAEQTHAELSTLADDATLSALLVLLGLIAIVVAPLQWAMIRSMTAPLEAATNAASRLAEGDLTDPLEDEGHDELATLCNTLGTTARELSSLCSDIQSGAEHTVQSSREVESTSTSVADGATRQAAAIEQVTATIHGIRERAEANGRHAAESEEVMQRNGLQRRAWRLRDEADRHPDAADRSRDRRRRRAGSTDQPAGPERGDRSCSSRRERKGLRGRRRRGAKTRGAKSGYGGDDREARQGRRDMRPEL